MADPEIIHLSLRLAPVNGEKLETNLGISVYFIFGNRQDPAGMKEYGLAFTLSKKRYEEVLEGRLLVHEVKPEGQPLRPGEIFPIEKLRRPRKRKATK
jgi:hypothetical protein